MGLDYPYFLTNSIIMGAILALAGVNTAFLACASVLVVCYLCNYRGC